MGKKHPRRLKRIFCAAAIGGGLLGLPGCVTAGNLQSRPLTPGERDMARSVFGDTIRYDDVKVYNGAPRIAGIVPLDDVDAISPSGNIFLVDPNNQRPDMSAAEPNNRKLLIHELTHVWQYQGGRNVNLEAAGLYIRNGFNYDRSGYAYDLFTTKDFSSLNLEQQAHMVEDYFALREMPPAQWPADRQQRLAKFEELLSPHLPVGTPITLTPPPPKKPAAPNIP